MTSRLHRLCIVVAASFIFIQISNASASNNELVDAKSELNGITQKLIATDAVALEKIVNSAESFLYSSDNDDVIIGFFNDDLDDSHLRISDILFIRANMNFEGFDLKSIEKFALAEKYFQDFGWKVLDKSTIKNVWPSGCAAYRLLKISARIPEISMDDALFFDAANAVAVSMSLIYGANQKSRYYIITGTANNPQGLRHQGFAEKNLLIQHLEGVIMSGLISGRIVHFSDVLNYETPENYNIPWNMFSRHDLREAYEGVNSRYKGLIERAKPFFIKYRERLGTQLFSETRPILCPQPPT